jgi:hypothetical protein
VSDEVYLSVTEGPAAGHRFAVPEGQTLTVGRSGAAAISLPEDKRLSALHFSIDRRGETVEIRDLDSTLGTDVNGRRTLRCVAVDSDTIRAGQSVFTLHIGTGRTEKAHSDAGETLGHLIFEVNQPLYALLDAARDRRIKPMLERHGAPYHSLYEGKQGEELSDFAPYLVRLYPDSPMIGELIAHAWGNSWGVYLRCSLSILEVRRHFRHFLMVKDELGEEFYFRYYDPRVLRVFLPTCTREQRLEFFGPIECFLMEDDQRERVLEFTATGDSLILQVDAEREYTQC